MSKKVEEKYEMTFKGWCSSFNCSAFRANEFINNLELYMRRRGHNAIVMNKEGGFTFENVIRCDYERKKK